MPEGIKITYSCPGLSELEEQLKSLPDKLARKHLANAMRAGLRIVQKAEKAGAPSDTGALRESITVYQRKRNKQPLATIEFGVKPLGKKLKKRKRPTNLASLIEFGTKPHMIVPKKEWGSLKLYGNRWVSHVQHPGAKPQPFINAAIDMNVRKVILYCIDHLANRLEKEFDKIGT